MSQNVTKSPENVTKSVTSPVTCHASRDCCNNNNNQSPLKNLKEQQSPTTVISKREKEFPSEKSKFPVTLRANKEPPALGQIMRQAGLSPEQLAAYPESPESPPVGMLEKALAAKRGPGRPRSRWQSESYDYEAIVADQLWLFLVPPLEPGGGEEPFPVEMKTPEFRAAWDDWLAVRVHHGWPKMTAKVLTNCLKVLVARFKKLGAGAPVADLRATIAKGWDSRIYVDNGYVAK